MATGGGDIVTQRTLCQTEVALEPQEILPAITGYGNMPLVSLEKAVEKLVDILPRIQYRAQKVKQRCQNPADGLTQDESASIMLYTMEWTPPEESLYIVLNNTLRSPAREKLQPWLLYLRLFLGALFRLPPTSCDVYRGANLDFDLLKNYTQNKTIIWWGFSSCTLDINILNSEKFLSKSGTRMMFIIHCHSGRDIHKHSYFKSESEVLLLPATQFTVTGCLDQSGLNIIKLTETDPSKIYLQPITSQSILSTPQYQNLVLQEKIDENKYSSKLDLQSLELTDQDMKIVAYYAIRNTRVRDLDFFS